VKFLELWQVPFHLLGGGPNPLSLKLSDSGQIPESSTPMMTSLSVVALSACSGKPIKSHDLVVWSCFFSLGKTATTLSCPAMRIFLVGKFFNPGRKDRYDLKKIEDKIVCVYTS